MTIWKSVFLVSLVFFSSFPAIADILTNEPLAETTRVLANVFKKKNVRGIAFDDALSKKIFKLYFDTLDDERLFFEANDVEAFRADELNLDDQILKGDLSFVAKVHPTYQLRARERIAMIRGILDEPIDFTVSEALNIDYAHMPFAGSASEARERLRKEIKAQVLRQKLDNPGKSLEVYKTVVRKRQEAIAKGIADMGDVEAVSIFLDAFARSFDPHSDYMAPQRAESFQAAVTLQHPGIGAAIAADEGEGHVVAGINPGTPAALDGTLKKDDKIVGVSPDGLPEHFRLTHDLSVDELIDLLHGKAESKVLLRVRRPGEKETRDVVLTRALIKNETARARGEVKAFGGARIGTIYLPTFYYDFKGCDENPETCFSSTNDVRALLMSEEFQKADAVILDLRNNTGGSLRAAIDIAGLFINTGPVTQIKGPEELKVYRDQDPRAFYGGPLVIVVNVMSASASEIVAAALQDDGRALVVGHDTFGKGTVQIFQALADVKERALEGEPLGAYKLSVSEFFRINGDSTQGPGVIPDVALPSLASEYYQREAEQPNALNHTTIKPVFYRVLAYVEKANVEQVVRNSRERRAQSEGFSKLEQAVAQAKATKQRKEILLHEEQRREQMKLESTPDFSSFAELVPLVISKDAKRPASAPPVDNFYNQEILQITVDYAKGVR